VKFYTAHLRDNAPPVLVREGFSWGAVVFGPLWLAAHRAWIPAALTLAADVLIATLTRGPVQAALSLAVAIWLGFSGNDLRRWSMQLRGFTLLHVIAARDETEALRRWLDGRPDLIGRFLKPGTTR
jgi:Protein of unknown function (DUF2628)